MIKGKEPERIKSLRVVILGGAGEIGLNCMVIEEKGELLMIDCGVAFPQDQVLGAELKIPDFSWVLERKQSLAGIVLTHGHEDHIGALPYLLKAVNCPVYGTSLTLGLVEERLREGKLAKKTRLVEVCAGERRKVGNFDLEFIQSSHSFADVVAIGLRTEQGILLHSGDFKLDPTPVDGKRMDLNALSRLGEEGVLAFFSDSTNVEQEGYTPSEREVGKALLEFFQQAKGRIIVALFASHIHRIQQVLDASQAVGRKVLIYGRSMEANTSIAEDLGYLSISGSVLAPLNKARNFPPEKLVVITTGSQGEPLSVLARMARGEHKSLKIFPGDTVILSSKFIPGNERAINRLIDDLYRKGAEVFYEKVSEIHCSGHASQEELKLALSLVRPKYLVPVHGEYRHLVKHKQLALRMGFKEEQCLVVEDGQVIEFYEREARLKERLNLEPISLDGNREGIPDTVLRERLRLAQSGVVFGSVGINREKRQRVSDAVLKFFGAVSEQEASYFLAIAKKGLEQKLDFLLKERSYSNSELEEELRKELRRLFKGQLGRRPRIFITVLEG